MTGKQSVFNWWDFFEVENGSEWYGCRDNIPTHLLSVTVRIDMRRSTVRCPGNALNKIVLLIYNEIFVQIIVMSFKKLVCIK